jgi:hypothetical protein
VEAENSRLRGTSKIAMIARPLLVCLAFAAALVVVACRPSPAPAVPFAMLTLPYPAHYAMLTSEERHAREADFRARNPGEWDRVDVDPFGFVAVETRDASIVDPQTKIDATDRELARWTAFLHKNAAFFGIGDARLALTHACGLHGYAGESTAYEGPYEVEQKIGAQVLATIRFDKEPRIGPSVLVIRGGFLPKVAIRPRRITDAAAIAPLVGQQYAIDRPADTSDIPKRDDPIRMHPSPVATTPVDCNHPPPWEAHHCPTSEVVTLVAMPSGLVSLRDEVLCVQRDAVMEVRVIVRVDLALPSLPHRPVLVRPLGEAPPMPRLIDAVTGENLSGTERRCGPLT